MVHTGCCLDTVGNNYIIIVIEHTTVIMEMNTRMEVTFIEGKIYVDKFSWLNLSCINCFSFWEICHIFCIQYSAWCLI